MKILHSSDWHLGLSRFPGRPEEADRVLNGFSELAHDERVDMVAIVGDLFDTRYPKPAELALAARIFRRLSALGVPVVITPGNHDGPSQIAAPDSHTLAWLSAVQLPNVEVLTAPGVTSYGPAVVAHLPYAHRRAYDVAGAGLGLQERHVAASKALEDLAAHLVEDAAEQAVKRGVPSLLMWHGTLVGSKIGSERSLRLEDELEIGSHILEPLTYALLGHIHLRQRIGKGHYAGAPMAIDFGEAGQEKAFSIVEIALSKGVITNGIDSGARPLVVTDKPAPYMDVEHALVRVTLDYAASRSDLQAVENEYRIAGADFVVAIAAAPARPQPSATRALAADVTPEDAVRAYLKEHDLPEEPLLSAARAVIASAD